MEEIRIEVMAQALTCWMKHVEYKACVWSCKNLFTELLDLAGMYRGGKKKEETMMLRAIHKLYFQDIFNGIE